MRTEPVAYEFFTTIGCCIVASRGRFDPNEIKILYLLYLYGRSNMRTARLRSFNTFIKF